MADEPVRLSIDDAFRLARDALIAAGAAPRHADRVAEAVIAAELDSRSSQGLAQIPVYAGQLAAGEIDGRAMPEIVQRAPSAITIDAHSGFAHAAIDLGLGEAVPCAATTGCCVLAVAHACRAGRLGPYVERIAESGQIGLAFAGGSAAPGVQGERGLVTDSRPLALAVPRSNAPPLVIDLSMTTVAQGHAMLAAQYGETAPQRELKDVQAGQEADARIAGAAQQGAALSLVIEIVAAALTARVAPVASSAGPDDVELMPESGPVLFLIDPNRLGGEDFGPRLESLLQTVPGGPAVCRRAARGEVARESVRRQGVAISAELEARLRALTSRSAPAE
ncbi:Ldh family oxidoreductase [Salinisphaera hydrothermalis]|uniref:Malate/L-lactate dehydrogenase family protein n=1 Tax=Salinisphaera hydrothermalis (strain C41B8) TaxID=1304275 RepID=A0A084IPP8_SALHC|nr:Ldh family oxidoreductase [Salinisphaera hydrothermalis]KEZ78682.1 Malate/L-lactate dehydrogenase family protein [Salinisphaera hydrothermalis C41B8]